MGMTFHPRESLEISVEILEANEPHFLLSQRRLSWKYLLASCQYN